MRNRHRTLNFCGSRQKNIGVAVCGPAFKHKKVFLFITNHLDFLTQEKNFLSFFIDYFGVNF